MAKPTENLAWGRARRCATSNCVEVAQDGDQVLVVRDSKGPQITTLQFTPQEWATFVAGVREGDFDF